jgi:hypothetical protein
MGGNMPTLLINYRQLAIMPFRYILITILLKPFFISVVAMEGMILDGSTDKPIVSAIITANGKEYRTDREGRYHIPNTESIGVRARGYERIFTRFQRRIYLREFHPKALYLSAFGAANKKIMHNAKHLIHSTQINALVIDVKMDRGQIAFYSSSPVAREIGALKMVRFQNLKHFIHQLKQDGIYTIARVVCFKDTPFVRTFPYAGVKYTNSALYRDREGSYWIDPSYKKAWNYILTIAEESAKAGFDEIQFDYVRFPDKRGLRFSVENRESERVRIISEFLEYARSRLTPYNVFIAADIFGYVCWNDADLGIGQRVDAMAPYVDYISPMLYPSSFQVGIPGYKNPVAANYQIVKHSLDKALEKSGGSPLGFRPWLQAFRDYAFDRRNYGKKEISEQIRASEDFGSSGWMLWNARNIYTTDGIIE